MALTTNSDYFPILHKLTGLYNLDGVFTARYEPFLNAIQDGLSRIKQYQRIRR